MISVRKACQGLAEGDEPASAALGAPHYTVEGDVLSRGAARMNLEEMGKELGMEDGRIRATVCFSPYYANFHNDTYITKDNPL